jgi:hypothetical protein
MKKVIVFLIIAMCIACSKEYITTEFYVKNTSFQTIYFEASVFKSSETLGPYEVFEQFTVYPGDSVLARRRKMEKDCTEPQKWFTSFVIYPVEGIQMNNPNLAENWVKSNKNDTAIYVFTLNKN